MTQPFRYCPSCGAALQGRFCSACGSAADRPNPVGPAAGRSLVPYLLGGALVVALLGALFVSERGGAPALPQPALAPAGTPPDLSAMTPRDRFDRLYDRIMRASETGDTSTVRTFTPMALAAYGMLESADADARFHAGLLRLAAGDGDGAGATALADTIEAQQPRHLFGILIRGSLARQNQNPAALKAAERDFLAAYPAEIAAGRPEYAGHQTLIDRFLKEAKP